MSCECVSMCVCLCVYVHVYVCVFEYVCSSMSLFIDQQMERWDLSLGRSILKRAGAWLPFSFRMAFIDPGEKTLKTPGALSPFAPRYCSCMSVSVSVYV